MLQGQCRGSHSTLSASNWSPRDANLIIICLLKDPFTKMKRANISYGCCVEKFKEKYFAR
jgi:hypothetical protein